MQQIMKQVGSSRQLFETVNFAFMKFFDTHLQKLSFLRGLSAEFIFFNFSDIVTYPGKLLNQN